MSDPLLCPHCGQQIESAVELPPSYRDLRGRGKDAPPGFDPFVSNEIFCAVCGATNEPTRPFCYSCGTFRGNPAAPTPARAVLRRMLGRALRARRGIGR